MKNKEHEEQNPTNTTLELDQISNNKIRVLFAIKHKLRIKCHFTSIITQIL
jgi:hypothetical protein